MNTIPPFSMPFFPVTIPNMINQVAFEGFLARAWLHGSSRYLRLANHRPPQMGGQSDGPITVESDYVTVRLDGCVNFDMNRAVPGLHLVVRGRIEGHDIPETIGDILRHCNLNLALSQDIARVTVTRPAVQIFCTFLEFCNDRAGAVGNRPAKAFTPKRRHDHRPPDIRVRENAPEGRPVQPSPAPQESIPAEKAGIQPGEDLAEVASQLEAKATAARQTRKKAVKKASADENAAPKARKSRRSG
jgi:hypothetical protein